MRILWYKDLYVGKRAEKNRRKIQWKVQHGAGTLGVYLITMPSNEHNSLDIINAAYLKQSVYKRRTIRVVGIAFTYSEALEVLESIAQDVYSNTEGLDIRSFFDEKHNFKKWQV